MTGFLTVVAGFLAVFAVVVTPVMMLATDWCCAVREKWLGEATQELGRRMPSQGCRVSVVAEEGGRGGGVCV